MEEEKVKINYKEYLSEKGRWIKGNPGGPGRTPGSISLTTLMRRELEKRLVGKDRKTKKTKARALIRKIYQQALNGNTRSQRLIWNYIEGLPVQPLDANVNMRVSNLVDIIKNVANETGDNKLPEKNLGRPDFIHGENIESPALAEGKGDNPSS